MKKITVSVDDIGNIESVDVRYEIDSTDDNKREITIAVFDKDAEIVNDLTAIVSQEGLLTVYDKYSSCYASNIKSRRWKTIRKILRGKYDKTLDEEKRYAIYLFENMGQNNWEREIDGLVHNWTKPIHWKFLNLALRLSKSYSLDDFKEVLENMKSFKIIMRYSD